MDPPGSRCADAGRLESHRREDEVMYRERNHLDRQIDRVQILGFQIFIRVCH